MCYFAVIQSGGKWIGPMIYKPNIFSFKRNERDSFS